MEVRFVILSPSGKHRTTTKNLPLLVGRSEESKLRIAQDCVSRRHCEFVAKGADVFVRDLNSTNGTLVDGEKIDPEVDTLIRPGCIVKVGGATFRVDYGTAGTTVAVPAATGDAAEKDTVPLTGEPLAVEVAAPDDDPPAPAIEGGKGSAQPAGPPAAATDFAFLGAGADHGDDDLQDAFPQSPDAAEPPSDGDLGDFFKSLS